MQNQVSLYVLPGFHGSPRLFTRLLAALPRSIDARVLAFTSQRDLASHVDAIAAELPEHPVYLLAESFSGPIAVELMARSPTRVRGAILSASFARTPYRALVSIASRLPLFFFRQTPWKKFLLRYFCLNGVTDNDLLNDILDVINDVEPAVVRDRLTVLAATDVTSRLAQIAAPVLCLKASADRVVHAPLTDRLADHLPHASIETIVGPHLLLQTQVERVAPRIAAFVEGVERNASALR